MPPKSAKRKGSQQQGGQQQRPVAGFVPPGAGGSSHGRDTFGYSFEPPMRAPRRLANVPSRLVDGVNDFHFAMMNDLPRNQFYWDLLQRHITPETGVLEIGAGSGLLSMMAAKLGAKYVVAVEGSPEMAELARRNIEANGFSSRVRVFTMMSSDLQLTNLPRGERPDILVSEIFGTMLLGESAHDYIADIRDRLLKPDSQILPRYGVQYAVPIECPVLDQITSVESWNGLDLHHVTALKDTASCVFTKKYGFRMSTVPFKRLSAPIPVVTVDFMTYKPGSIPLQREWRVPATASGVAHCMMLSWKAWHHDESQAMSTDPDDTRDNFPRDMQWGQALQLLDGADGPLPIPVKVEEGTELVVQTAASHDGVVMQFNIRSAATTAAAAAATTAAGKPPSATAADTSA